MVKIIILIILSISLSALAAKEKATHESLADLLEEIRDPLFNSEQRIKILEFSRKMMTQKLAQEMGVSVTDLNLAFIKNPSRSSLLLRDPWYDVQTQFYTTLHQENYLERWLELQKLIKFSDYGKSLHNTIMASWGEYSPVKEGNFYARWSKIEIKADGKNRSFNVPFFLMSPNTSDLIKMEAHVPFEDLIKGDVEFLKNTSQLSRTQRQELAEKMVLNNRIYQRTVANAAKTIASIHYLTGNLNRHQSFQKVQSFIDGNCENCSKGQRDEYAHSAMIYADHMKKTMDVVSTPAEVMKGFCKSLKRNNYYWNIEQFKPTPIELLNDSTRLGDYYVVHKLKGKNREAIAKTIIEHDMGVLFLTDAINIMDKTREPVGTKLGCTRDSEIKDTTLITEAILEAHKNVETYLIRINQRLKTSPYDLKNIDSILEYFVQTNQGASAQAVSGFPQGIGWLLKTITLLDQNVNRRKKMDKFVAWGGTIVGIGLTLTGIGAPEGVTILITTAGIVKGISTVSYSIIRAGQEKSLALELRIAQRGNSEMSADNLRMHYENYKSLKIDYIKELGQTALSFRSFYKLALTKSGGDVVKTHDIMNKVIIGVKESGKEQAIEKVQEMILELAVQG